MAYEETGASLSMTKSAVLKTTATDNGLLEKIHEGAYTFGYTKLVPASGDAGVEFGSGAWYDASEKNNTVYAVKPSGDGAVPVLAGVFVRQPYIAAGFPARPDRIEPQNKGLICYEGKVKYKTGLAANGANCTDVLQMFKLVMVLIFPTLQVKYTLLHLTLILVIQNSENYPNEP